MAREFAKKFYNSKAWKITRQSYIHSVHGLCEHPRCNDAGYIVHHKIELTPQNINDANISLGFGNLEYLCLKHHNMIHMPASATVEGVKFDKNGNLIKDE
jgi:hypothetical protein